MFPRAILFAGLLTTACSTPPPPQETKAEPAGEEYYTKSTRLLEQFVKEAEATYAKKDADRAAQIIAQAEPLANKLLEASRPTVDALNAATDLDDLKGRMYMDTRQYGWARMTFQKNVARWKHINPPTPNSTARLDRATKMIIEADRKIDESSKKK